MSEIHEKMFSRIQNILVDKLFILYFLRIEINNYYINSFAEF